MSVSLLTGVRSIAGGFLTGYASGGLPPLPSAEELYGQQNPAEPNFIRSCARDPVNCDTGNETESQTDLQVAGGRGIPLGLTRTYNAQAAATAKAPGSFGYGWTSSYSDHLVLESEAETVRVIESNGSGVVYSGKPGQPGELRGPARAQAKLVCNSDGTYTYTLPSQTAYHFDSEGHLLSETDRNGNVTSLTYNASKQLETIADATGRKLTFKYNTEGLVESATDPAGHEVKYTYEGANLASVTLPGGGSPRWQFKYDGSHRLTTMTDGRGGKTLSEYDSSNRVIKQTDPMSRVTKFEYQPHTTYIRDEATGSVTKETFTEAGEPETITRGYGTSLATTETSYYDGAGDLVRVVDGAGHATRHMYDTEGNLIATVDATGNETQWSYDNKHDVTSITTPKGETTTIKRDNHGNAEVIERPAPGGTQKTIYKYGSHGELESLEDALKHVWKYEYTDSHDDRTAETDQEGDKRSWEYDEDSQIVASTSPRGNAAKEPSKYVTKTTRDALERPEVVTDPLGHTTRYEYDADGNLEATTDPNGHTTKYEYDPDNELVKTTAPNGATAKTEYDGEGHVVSQTDGNGHTTKYVRNVLGEVEEVVDPRKRVTHKEYDSAGNLKKATDPLRRTTTYQYDAANRLTEVAYSDERTHSVLYEYDKDGNRTKMIDGSGTTTYSYDELDRLTETKDGHGDVVKYEYNLGNEQTKLTYPNGKAVTRGYDKAGRLEKVTDWLGNATSFQYDADSDLTKIVYPSGTGEQDVNTYNDADQLTKNDFKKGTEVQASLSYTRDSANQLKTTTQKGLPGEEKTTYSYDENERLTKAGATEYKYDNANQATKLGTSTNTYSEAGEIEKTATASYGFDELGERTSQKPSSGPTTTYGYDQAGNLTTVTRPHEGEVPAIEDSYGYDGTGLRVSQTNGGMTSYLTWQLSSAQNPLLLSDGSDSYVYGLGEMALEQVANGASAPEYLHHDQQDSTRLISGEKGEAIGTFTYSAYGEVSGHTGTATTALGYDDQYATSDTGLLYLRARSYDPATGQFLSVDPQFEATGARYFYAGDNPPNAGDPTGRLCIAEQLGFLEGVGPSCHELVQGGEDALNAVGDALEAAERFVTAHASVIAATAGVFGAAVTPFAPPLGVALEGVAAAASGLAADKEVSQGKPVAAAIDALGAVVGGASLAARFLGALAESGAAAAQTFSELATSLRAAAEARYVAGILDRIGDTALATSILNSIVNPEGCG